MIYSQDKYQFSIKEVLGERAEICETQIFYQVI